LVAKRTDSDKNTIAEPVGKLKVSSSPEPKLSVNPNEVKVTYLAVENASEKRFMPLRNWKLAINQFMIMLPDRMPH
jgi:hypothetical protein